MSIAELYKENDENFKFPTHHSSFSEDHLPMTFTNGLYKQLLGKNRQKSKFYNILLLSCFNINISHFCFPYFSNKIGIIPSIILIIVSTFISSLTQKKILSFLTNYKSECNYSKVVQTTLGEYVSILVEVFVGIWFLSILLLSSLSLLSFFIMFFDNKVSDEYMVYIKIVSLLIVFILYTVFNIIDKSVIIDFLVFICIFIQILSLVIQIIFCAEYKTSVVIVNKSPSITDYLDIINITTIYSNTITLNFWVHSKYSLSNSTDNSSSIVNISSIIVLAYYIISFVLSGLTELGQEIPFFILLNSKSLYQNRGNFLFYTGIVYQFINSVSLFLMVNFYFRCIREVVFRKNLAVYFYGKK